MKRWSMYTAAMQKLNKETEDINTASQVDTAHLQNFVPNSSRTHSLPSHMEVYLG